MPVGLVVLVGGCDLVLGLERASAIAPDAGTGAGTTTGTTTSVSTGGGACVPGATEACYDGPDGTEGKGPCRGGTRTCNMAGTAYEPCSGEITPQQEDCTTPDDENCDGLTPPCQGSLVWAKGFGDTSNQLGPRVATDSSGNAVIAGTFFSSIDFGGGPLTNAGDNPDMFLAKLGASGEHLWSKSFGDSGDQYCADVAVDSAGNILVTGSFFSSVDFGGGPLNSASASNDIFVAKLDALGNHVWSKSFGDDKAQAGTSIAADINGNTFVVGDFAGSVDFGGGALTTLGAGHHVFIAKFDPSGKHLWSKGFGSPGEQHGVSVAADNAGNAIITGSFIGAVDFGGNPLASVGNSNPDIFVAKFAPDGKPLWSKGFGDSGEQRGVGIAVDSASNVLLVGNFGGTVNFGGGAIKSTGAGFDIFVAKLDADGAHMWSKGFGDSGIQVSTSVAVDGKSNVLVTGYFTSSVNFGGGPLTSAGSNTDVFVAKLSASGQDLGSMSYGDMGSQQGTSIAVDGNDSVFVAGEFDGTIDFGSGPILSSGATDIFVAKFSK